MKDDAKIHIPAITLVVLCLILVLCAHLAPPPRDRTNSVNIDPGSNKFNVWTNTIYTTNSIQHPVLTNFFDKMKMTPTQPLPLEFKRDGFYFRQARRSQNAAIYEQRRRPNGEIEAWEVIQIRVAKAERLFGKDYPDRELYPPAEAWGKAGWTVTDRNKAFGMFYRLAEFAEGYSRGATKTPEGYPG